MPTFEYVAKDKTGKNIRGIQEAESVHVVVDSLHKQQCVVIKVEEHKPKASLFTKSAGSHGRRRRVKLMDLVIFSRQAATLLEAGVSLVQSLDILAQQMENPKFQTVILKLHDDVSGGVSFSEALAKHPKVFSELFVNLVRAGESSGSLDEILQRLSTYLEKSHAVQTKVKGALIYPAVVTGMAIIITFGMMTFIIPQFADIFAQLGAQLPAPTRILIVASQFLRANLVASCAGAVGALIAFRLLLKTPVGRYQFDALKLRMPIFGSLFLKASVSKFSRTLATLVKSGVSILAALDIVAKTAGNVTVERLLNRVREAVREGAGIAKPLERGKLFPLMVVRMIAVGEETGELDQMLGKIADFYESEVENAVANITSLIEPLIVLFLGLVVGGIVVSLFLPILTLTQVLG